MEVITIFMFTKNVSSRFYVYALLDTSLGEIFYIGKGTGRRMYTHLSIAKQRDEKGEWKHNTPVYQRIRSILEKGYEITCTKLLTSLTEEHAHENEVRLINEIGKKKDNSGPLENTNDGGASGGITTTIVKQYTMKSEYVATFLSAKDAMHHTGANDCYIGQCCKGKRKSAGGFLWAYENDPVPVYTHKYNKRVRQYDTDGNIIRIHESLIAAAQSIGASRHAIISATSGDAICGAGYIWIYDDENADANLQIKLDKFKNKKNTNMGPIAVTQFDLTGNIIQHFETIVAAAKSINVSGAAIQNAIDQPNRTVGGFMWRRKTDMPIDPFRKKESTRRKRVDKLDLHGNVVESYNSVRQAAAANGIRNSAITNVLIGLCKTSGGFKWKYKD